jgi:hypothetical protein
VEIRIQQFSISMRLARVHRLVTDDSGTVPEFFAVSADSAVGPVIFVHPLLISSDFYIRC